MVDGDEGSPPPAPGAIRRLATTTVTVTSESELRDAIAAASDTTIVLGSDITVTQQIEVAGGQTNLVVKAGARCSFVYFYGSSSSVYFLFVLSFWSF